MKRQSIRTHRRRRGRKAGAPTKTRHGEPARRSRRRISRRVAALAATCLLVLLLVLSYRTRRHQPHPREPGLLESLPEYDPYIANFLQGVREAPDDADRYARLGLVYEANKFWAEARTCYEHALRLTSEQLLTRYHLAIVNQKLGNTKNAESLYREILKQHAEFAPALHRLGDLLAEAGHLEEADAAFRRVMELAPDSAAGYTSAAAVKLRERDYESAAALATKALAVQPGALLPHFQLGRAYQGLRQTEDAAGQLELGKGAVKLFLSDEWTESFPKHTVGVPAHVRLERARAYLNQGDPQRAIDHLEFALGWYPDDVELLVETGAVYLLLNQPDKACERLERAQRLASDDPRVPANLAMCLALLGSFEQAMAAADQAVALAPSSSMSHIARGRVMMRQGRFDDALANLLRAVEVDDKDATAHLELGHVYMLMNRFEDSRRQYQTTVDLDPSSLEGRLRLSDMAARLGDLVEAQSELEAARRMSPNHPQVQELSKRLDSLKE